MKKTIIIMNNEKGSVLAVSLMILLLLTIIGIAAVKTTTVELQIAGNEVAYKKAFYESDSGVYWGVATLREADVTDLTAGDPIPVPGDLPFLLTHLGHFTDGATGTIHTTVRSDAAGGLANSSIQALIQLPKEAGPLDPPGDEGEY